MVARIVLVSALVVLVALVSPGAVLAVSNPLVGGSPAPWWITTQLTVGQGDDRVPLVAEGRVMWQRVTESGGQSGAFVRDLATGTTSELGWPSYQAFDGQLGLSGSEFFPGDVALTDVSTGERRRLSGSYQLSTWMGMNPLDGGRALFTDTEHETLVLYDWATDTTTTVADNAIVDSYTENGRTNAYVRSFPSLRGDYIVWRGWQAGRKSTALFLKHLPTGKVTRIAALSDQDLGENGSACLPLLTEGCVVYESWEGGASRVYVYDIEKGTLSSIGSGRINLEAVGEEGAVVLLSEGDPGSYFYDFANGSLAKLPHIAQQARIDGDFVAYIAPSDYKAGPFETDVYVYDVRSGRARRLSGEGQDIRPSIEGNYVVWEGRSGIPGQNDWNILSAEISSTPPAAGFPDTGTSPYRTAIDALFADGVLEGYAESGRAGPDDPVRRAQFAKMVCLGLAIDVDESMEAPFDDLGEDFSGTFYPTEFVAAAEAHGIVRGVKPRIFHPWDNITRAQVITMTVRALEALATGRLRQPPQDFVGSVGRFDSTHAEAMRVAEFNGLLDGVVGFGGGWNPWVPMTRGEIAQILWNVIEAPRSP